MRVDILFSQINRKYPTHIQTGLKEKPMNLDRRKSTRVVVLVEDLEKIMKIADAAIYTWPQDVWEAKKRIENAVDAHYGKDLL